MIGSAIIVVAGIVSYMLMAGGSADLTKQDAQAALGIGRPVINTSAGATIQAAIGTPAGTLANSVKWRARGDLDTQFAPAGGAGKSLELVAPDKGTVIVEISAKVHGQLVHSTTKIVVLEDAKFVGTDVTTSGKVMVDDGAAVQGEGLLQGAHVNAEQGSISFMVKAKADGTLRGLLQADGIFTVSAKNVGENRLNRLSIKRDPNGTRKMTTEVEHLDGTHYTQVATPDSLAMVKGTKFTTTVTPSGSSTDVIHGVVGVMDRFRNYVREQDLTAGEHTDVEASPESRAAEDWTDALTGPPTADGETAPVTAPEQEPMQDEHADHATPVSNDVTDHQVSNTPSNQSGDSGPAAGATQPPPPPPTTIGTAPLPPSTVITSPVDTSTNGTSQTPPPTTKEYILEEYSLKVCLPSHRVWSERLTKHLCYPREKLPSIFVESMGYRPLKINDQMWGCMNGHALWSINWCLALAPAQISLSFPYRPPQGRYSASRVDTMDACYAASTPASHLWLADGLCHSRAP